MIQCKTCKKKISEKAKVCPNCGEKTIYGIRNQRNAISIIIALVIIIALALTLGLLITKTNNIKGSWKITKDYKKPKTHFSNYLIIEGKETVIYKFKDNNKCKRTITIDGEEKLLPREVGDVAESKPFNNSIEDKCTYKIKNNKILIKYEYQYDEKFYIRIEKNNLYLDGDKYIKMD